jgi:Protein of unknown function (DUF3631)
MLGTPVAGKSSAQLVKIMSQGASRCMLPSHSHGSVRKGRHAPETLEDRSITIELRRRLKEEKITRLRSNRMGHLEALGRQAMRWAMDNRNLLSDADPMLPEELGDRAQDNWRMLIAIAVNHIN